MKLLDVAKAVIGHPVLWAGLGIVVLGAAPGVIVTITDPSANPVGLGFLLVCTAIPGTGLIMLGGLLGYAGMLDSRAEGVDDQDDRRSS